MYCPKNEECCLDFPVLSAFVTRRARENSPQRTIKIVLRHQIRPESKRGFLIIEEKHVKNIQEIARDELLGCYDKVVLAAMDLFK